MVLEEMSLPQTTPPSLRSRGATIIELPEMLANLSTLESQNLEMAIKNKNLQIDELKTSINNDEPHIELSQKDAQSLKNHYKSKLDFYQGQNNTKWKHWPNKTKTLLRSLQSQTKKRRNFKKHQHRKDRRAERDAKRALETGSVVVLVNEEIPPGALALLGKGLGYVPTPSKDHIDLRLDMKLVTNKILNYSNRVLAGETRIPTIHNLPAKLRRKKTMLQQNPVMNQQSMSQLTH